MAANAVGTVFIDLLFALLPWNFVWKLNMSRKDKLIIAGSLSLGLLCVSSPILADFSGTKTDQNPLQELP